MTELAGKRVLVTGGAGSIGRHLCRELETREPAEIAVRRSSEYDLTEQAKVRELYEDARPDIVIHAAAEVGGIGANRVNPAATSMPMRRWAST